MAWIAADAIFNPDTMATPVIGIASELMRHDSGFHQHQKGQLLFAQKGCMRIVTQTQFSVVPPQRVVWLPPNVMHRVFFTEVVGYRSIYIDTKHYQHLSSRPTTWSSTLLLRTLLEEIAYSQWDISWQAPSRAGHWLLVLWDELCHAEQEAIYLEFPTDYRLKNIDFLQDAPQLQYLAKQVGASERTITRIFQKETGMNYQSWRQQWRLLRAIELLSEDRALMDIALILGFSNDSAFSIFFKSMTGISPGKYLVTL